MKPKTKSMTLTVALAAVLALAAARPCAADTLTVTSTDDAGIGTLRAALASAADGDTINFTLTTPATIALASGRLVVDKSVTIAGPGRDLLTVDGQHADTVFHIYPSMTVTISGLTIANGFAYESSGGGVVNAGTLTIRDCTLRDNSATYRGGGVENGDRATLTITGCILSGNKVLYSGNLLTGGGAISIFTRREDPPATVTIESSTLTDNTAVNYGGAIFMYVLDGYISRGFLTVANSTLSGNSVSGGPLARGGGIYVRAASSRNFYNAALAFVTVENSTLSGNSVSGSTEAYGGGIACEAVSGHGFLTLKNSTLSGNSATTTTVPGVGYGGAIATYGLGWLTLDNSTLNGNWDDGLAGGIYSKMSVGGSTRPVSIKNTILNAGPSGANLFNDGGLFQSYGYNLCSDDGAGLLTDPTDRINTDPMLGPLADNGGPTFTHALLAGSPAIDAGSATDSTGNPDSAGNPVTTDQRGVARPQGSANDIGAFELVPAVCDTPVATITGPPSGAVFAVGAPVTFTGTFSGDSGPHTAQWTIDGNVVAGTVDEVAHIVAATVTFTGAGVYSVQLTVANACGKSSTTDTVDGLPALVVIYDPSAGFVTGGGWLMSPAGAAAWDAKLTGKASFGFVSKYQKGAQVPTGETEFQFKTGGLNFKSTSYQWLVVAGARAQYKGAGTINGAAGYSFLLTAIDGQINGGGGADKFRIKIWETASGAIVYDNQMGADDGATPSTVLGGGSIVIHK